MSSAAIFDMDGLLVDSEPLWHEAEIAAFARVGVRLDSTACLQTTGLRVDETVDHWYRRHAWTGTPPAELTADIVDRVTRLIAERAVAKSGATAAVSAFEQHGFRLALASSSPERVIAAVLDRLDLGRRFEVVVSAEHEKYGKPHPAIYLTAASQLGIAPTSCTAIEDSLNGVIAAKAAKMTCIAVPDVGHRGDPRFALADQVFDSLDDLVRSFGARKRRSPGEIPGAS